MMKLKECKHCGEMPETTGVGLGNQCRICKNGLYRYGMNRNDMIALHESQNKKCLICETEVVMFNGIAGGVIDHCHTTNTVRGILCQQCNIAVGAVENHADFDKVLAYIE